jgi:hypothetical protein
MSEPLSEQDRSAFKEIERNWHEPIVRAPGSPQLVYGYLRLDEDDQESAGGLYAEIDAFAATEQLIVGGIFTDWDVADDAFQRPAFSGLLDVLRLPSSHGAVIAAWQHLSAIPDEMRHLLRQVCRTGSRLYVVRDGQEWAAGEGEPDSAPMLDGQLPKHDLWTLSPEFRLAYQRFLRRLRG